MAIMSEVDAVSISMLQPRTETRTQLAGPHPPMEIIVLLLDDALLAAVLNRRNLLNGGCRLFALFIAAFFGKQSGHVVVVVCLLSASRWRPAVGKGWNVGVQKAGR